MGSFRMKSHHGSSSSLQVQQRKQMLDSACRGTALDSPLTHTHSKQSLCTIMFARNWSGQPGYHTTKPCGVVPSSCRLSSENGGIRHSKVVPSSRSILKVPLKYEKRSSFLESTKKLIYAILMGKGVLIIIQK